MNANTEIDIAKLYAAIVADIKAQYPQLVTVEFDRDERAEFEVPACLLELTEWEPHDLDPGTEQQAVMARFEARIIMGFKTPKVKLEMRKLAAAMTAWIRTRRWSNPDVPGKKLPTGAAEFMGAAPDSFNPELDKFEVWSIEWQQVLHFGESVWNDEGTAPTDVLVSFSPDVGLDHGDTYTEITS